MTNTAVSGGQAKLVFLSGPARGKVVPLLGERVRIGRRPTNEIVIDIVQVVSSFHAAIVWDAVEQAWSVEDLDSKNGTFVNGQPVKRARLCEGDTIAFAPHGPQARFTCLEPQLPSIFETTRSTFERTGSINQAIKELVPAWPFRKEKAVVSATGIGHLLDDRLERLARRTRWLVVSSLAVLIVLGGIGLFAALWAGRREAGETSGAVSAAAAPLPQVELVAEIRPVYSSLFLSSMEHPIGQVNVVNEGSEPLRGALLTFEFLKEAQDYLAEPFHAAVPEVPAGGTIGVPIRPRFTDKVRIPVGRDVSALVRLTCQGRVVKEAVRGVFVHGHNVFNWENPRRIAALIDPDDPAVREFVRMVWRAQPPESIQDFPPPRFQQAVSLITALSELGFRYLPDPEAPAATHADGKASDQVNSPWETLLSRTGDCDDLTVLCASALEAVDIPVALAVGPTHVLPMFDCGLEGPSLESAPLDPATFVTWKRRTWIPLETTRLGRPGANFATVWSAAWPLRDSILSGEMQIVEVREAWKDFAPSGNVLDSESRGRLTRLLQVADEMPKKLDAALTDLKDLMLQNLKRKVDEIEKRESGLAKDMSVALLYAQNGLFERAQRLFKSAVFGGASIDPARLEDALKPLPALPELPHLLFDLGICLTLGSQSRQDLTLAASCYQAGLSRLPSREDSPERGEYLLHLALVHRLQGDLASERSVTEQAFRAAPDLQDVYRKMVAGDGRRAGSNDDIRRYLLKGLK